MATLKTQLKARLCKRDLDPGDVVRVPDGKWEEMDHAIGGPGRWAIYVGKSRNKNLVRPLGGDGVTGKPVETEFVEHLDDVIQEAAIAAYYHSKGRKRAK